MDKLGIILPPGGSASSASSALVTNASRRVNFTSSAALTKPSKDLPLRSALQKQESQASISSGLRKSSSVSTRGPAQAHRPLSSHKGNHSDNSRQKGADGFSFSSVQAAGGAQKSLGSEVEYWSYSPPTPSVAHRAFPSASRHDGPSSGSEKPVDGGVSRSWKTSRPERLHDVRSSNILDRGKTDSPGAAALRQALHSLNDENQEAYEQLEDSPEWQEVDDAQESQGANDAIAGALWKKRIPRSAHYPICCRTARERCAYTTSDDWAIFALHNQYVRPLRDREWLPGEPCIIRTDSFELPPGACKFSESTCGLSATAFNSFVFPNPPRQFLMSYRGAASTVPFAMPSGSMRTGRARGRSRAFISQLTQQQLLDLERMLWFDPEPRLDRPFRLYADSKGCLKGRIHDIGHIMRCGW
ncbi:uncharacterized protein LOC34621791 [Cyclospora cayetanensis]|uniref:Uncharacterized protein n=2 Tax=Cyclospora cayetanensis TaxID=88456 RepID=A0A1D3CXH1_9EIME|nr:uncharacterized protein LOC34621791 [Cyclospora cayetanensis]OEH75903.1 hypothetical protein cyc_05439 [Cyclospora cayetanensis]